MSERYHLIDGRSDGMCGSVTMKDSETGATESVYWSVTHPDFKSQGDAKDEAIARLEARAPMAQADGMP